MTELRGEALELCEQGRGARAARGQAIERARERMRRRARLAVLERLEPRRALLRVTELAEPRALVRERVLAGREELAHAVGEGRVIAEGQLAERDRLEGRARLEVAAGPREDDAPTLEQRRAHEEERERADGEARDVGEGAERALGSAAVGEEHEASRHQHEQAGLPVAVEEERRLLTDHEGGARERHLRLEVGRVEAAFELRFDGADREHPAEHHDHQGKERARARGRRRGEARSAGPRPAPPGDGTGEERDHEREEQHGADVEEVAEEARAEELPPRAPVLRLVRGVHAAPGHVREQRQRDGDPAEPKPGPEATHGALVPTRGPVRQRGER